MVGCGFCGNGVCSMLRAVPTVVEDMALAAHSTESGGAFRM